MGIPIPVTTMREISDIRKEVKANTDTIDRIIAPSDLTHQDVTSWDNVDLDRLKDELAYTDWTYGINHPYGDYIHEVAINLFIDEMVRAPFDHLNFNSRDKCVIEGYWLYDMSNTEVWDRVNENWEDIEHRGEYESSAIMIVEGWVMDKYLENLE